MEALIGVFCVLVVPGLIGYWIGWAARGRREERSQAASPTSLDMPRAPAMSAEGRSHAAWLVDELDRGEMRSTLSRFQRNSLRRYYAQVVVPPVDWQPEPVAPEPRYEPAPAFQPTIEPVSATSSSLAGAIEPVVGPQLSPAPSPATDLEPVPPAFPEPTALPEPSPEPAPRPRRPEIEWDPAVLMLYLGAFLVVAAGLVYASYNWADLGPWQKLSLLIAATVAFVISGWLLLPSERMREAAETFIGTGALLVPANAIAAWTVFEREEAGTALIVLVGSLATALLYTIFSVRPGGLIYSYGAAIAGALAIGAVLPAFGTSAGWGGVTAVLASTIAPDLGNRLGERWRHLRLPVLYVSIASLVIGFGVAMANAGDERDWLRPAALAAATLSLARFTVRERWELAGIPASLAGFAAIATTLIVLDVESLPVWTVVILASAIAAIAVAEVAHARYNLPLVRAVLHGESIAVLALAAMMGTIHAEWLGLIALTVAVAAVAVVAWRRDSRFWLVPAALFAISWWMLLPMAFGREGTSLDALRWAIPLPLLLGGAAWLLDRSMGASRDRSGAAQKWWGDPLWLVTGLTAIVISSVPGGNTGEFSPYPWITMTIAFGLYALTSLFAAWETRQPWVRVGYGVWAVLAIGLATRHLSLHPSDWAVTMLIATAVLATITLATNHFPGPLRSLATLWQPPGPSKTPMELIVFGATAVGMLVAMLVGTAAYVSGGDRIFGDAMPGLRWTWTVYLLTYAAIAVAAVVVGMRATTRESHETLVWIALGFGSVFAILAMKLLTSDPLAWSRAGIGAGAALAAASQVREPGNPFLHRLASRALPLGLVVLAVSMVADLSIVLADRQANSWIEVAMYAALAIAAIGFGMRTTTPEHQEALAWLALGFAGISGILAMRALTTDPLAWSRAGIGVGSALVAVSQLREPAHSFLRRLANRAWQLGLVVMATSVATDLAQVFTDDGANAWIEVAIFAAFAVTAVALGLRATTQEHRVALAWIVLGFASISSVLAMRQVTSDPLTWSRAGVGAGTILATVSAIREPANPFLRFLAAWAERLGLAVVTGSVAANVWQVLDGRADNTWAEAALYAVLGVMALGVAYARVRPWLTLVAITSLSVALAFALREISANEVAIPGSLLAFAWAVAGATLSMGRLPGWQPHQAAARTGALVANGLALVIAFNRAEPIDVTSSEWQVVITCIVSLAGLLAVDAYMQRDRLRGIVASAIAMLALLLEIGVEEPANIQYYTVPAALYLLALGYVERREPRVRDALLAMGSGLLLVPPLLTAQAEGDFTQLLIGGIEALILFMAGAVLQLRVPIAAGIIAITIIALRVLVDAANALPGWVTLLAGGLILLTLGTILLSWKERFRELFDRLRQEWFEMG